MCTGNNLSFYRSGGKPDSYPSPVTDWKLFSKLIQVENQKIGKVWNPITEQTTAYIDIPLFLKMRPSPDIGGARDYLLAHEWPAGLVKSFIKELSKCPLRFFLIDDSNSMNEEDGHKLVDQKGVKT